MQLETELAREAVKVVCRCASFSSSRAKTYDNGDEGFLPWIHYVLYYSVHSCGPRFIRAHDSLTW